MFILLKMKRASRRAPLFRGRRAGLRVPPGGTQVGDYAGRIFRQFGRDLQRVGDLDQLLGSAHRLWPVGQQGVDHLQDLGIQFLGQHHLMHQPDGGGADGREALARDEEAACL
jgi:hypothetical protein